MKAMKKEEADYIEAEYRYADPLPKRPGAPRRSPDKKANVGKQQSPLPGIAVAFGSGFVSGAAIVLVVFIIIIAPSKEKSPATPAQMNGIGSTTSDINQPQTATPGPAAETPTYPATYRVVLAYDNGFLPKVIQVRANSEITVEVINKGLANHNWHLIGLEGRDGKKIYTNLLPSGSSAEITFIIDKIGTYAFICDVHPVDMMGVLFAGPFDP